MKQRLHFTGILMQITVTLRVPGLPLYVTQAKKSKVANSVDEQYTGHAHSLPSQSPGLLGMLSTDWKSLSSNLLLNLDMFLRRNVNKRSFGA